jgi:hypothetical protein
LTSAGYSGTPLARKLGIKSGMACATVGAPPNYMALLDGLPRGVAFDGRDASGPLDFIHLFVERREALAERIRDLGERLAPAGMIWVSWPKKASGIQTDVDGNVVRAAGLEAGFVDIKVCAVDETWSALKFVIPKAARHTAR